MENEIVPGSFSVICSWYFKPMEKEGTPSHVHDFDEVIGFLGGNPEDVKDLGAEIEVTLGEEEEKHIVKTASIVRIPKGLRHGPFNFKRVDKPIVFMNVTLSPEYSRVRGNMCEHS